MASLEYAQSTAIRARRLLKAEMEKRGMSYRDLAHVLFTRGAGKSANEVNIRNQINRGHFSAAFFIECCLAMGSHVVRLGEPGDD